MLLPKKLKLSQSAFKLIVLYSLKQCPSKPRTQLELDQFASISHKYNRPSSRTKQFQV